MPGDVGVDTEGCNQWLGDYLKSGPKPSVEVFKAAMHAGYTKDQVKDAKDRIGAVAQKQGFQEGTRWTWRLRTMTDSTVGLPTDLRRLGFKA